MGQFNEQQFELKTGQSIIVRRAEVNDAQLLMECIATYLTQSDYIPKYDFEIYLTREGTEKWISEFIEQNNSLLLVATYQDRIIGNIDLKGHHRAMMAHTGVIGMGMLAEWRNIGVGTALMTSLIEWSTHHPTLEILWLQVFTENHQGLGLYRKMGFEDNGTIRGFFKKHGHYYDMLTMSRRVK